MRDSLDRNILTKAEKTARAPQEKAMWIALKKIFFKDVESKTKYCQQLAKNTLTANP